MNIQVVNNLMISTDRINIFAENYLLLNAEQVPEKSNCSMR